MLQQQVEATTKISMSVGWVTEQVLFLSEEDFREISRDEELAYLFPCNKGMEK